MKFIDAMTAAYLECAAWASGGDTDPITSVPLESLDDFDFSTEAEAEAREVCRDFLVDNFDDIVETEMSAEQCGHDLLLTRDRHGAGFWDRGYREDIGARLTEAAHLLGGANAMLGDDRLIYFM